MPRLTRSGCVVERHGRKIVRFDGDVPPACAAGGGVCPCGLRTGATELDSGVLGVEAPAGRRLEVSVSGGGVTRVAAILFAMPLVALMAAAWAGEAVAPRLGVSADAAAAGTGLAALALTAWLALRSGSALLRMLELNARPEQDES